MLLNKVRISRRIHPAWIEQERIKEELKEHKISIGMGKWQYFYTNNEGCVGLIKISVPSVSSFLQFNKNQKIKFGMSWVWECHTLKGNYFEDARRYKSKKEAEEFIYNVMGGNI